MHETLCSWVPGTLNVVRLQVAGRTVELRAAQVVRILGRPVLDDLYLRGRATVQASPQQVALLA